MKGNVKILRFNPKTDEKPYYREYKYEYEEGMTVLDVLNYIYDNLDTTLSYSYNCGNGHCGVCALEVDAKPVLSCKKLALPNMILKPLNNIRVIKDLIIDRDEYEKKLPKLRLFLDRQCEAQNEPEKVDMTNFNKFKTASRCIECLACISVCPIYAKSPHLFLGPMAYVLEARHLYDPRDDLNRQVVLKNQGVDLCIECGLCSTVCIHKVNPCETIIDLKKHIRRL